MRKLKYILFIFSFLLFFSCEKVEEELASVIDTKSIVLENKSPEVVKELVKGRWKLHSTYYPLIQITERYKNVYWTFEDDFLLIETEEDSEIEELHWLQKYPDCKVSTEMLNIITTNNNPDPNYILSSDMIIRKIEKGFLILDQSYWNGGIHKLSKFK